MIAHDIGQLGLFKQDSTDFFVKRLFFFNYYLLDLTPNAAGGRYWNIYPSQLCCSDCRLLLKAIRHQCCRLKTANIYLFFFSLSALRRWPLHLHASFKWCDNWTEYGFTCWGIPAISTDDGDRALVFIETQNARQASNRGVRDDMRTNQKPGGEKRCYSTLVQQQQPRCKEGVVWKGTGAELIICQCGIKAWWNTNKKTTNKCFSASFLYATK